MASLNKVMIIGNLGKDPEVRYTPDGMAIANFSLATASSWKDKATGEKKEETEWHRVVFYGKVAEIVGQYAKKGRPLYVEGRLKTRKWADKDGVERYTTEIIGEQMQLLGSREGMGEPDSGRSGGMGHGMASDDVYTPNPAGAGNRGAGAYANNAPIRKNTPPVNPLMDDDDIPF